MCDIKIPLNIIAPALGTSSLTLPGFHCLKSPWHTRRVSNSLRSNWLLSVPFKLWAYMHDSKLIETNSCKPSWLTCKNWHSTHLGPVSAELPGLHTAPLSTTPSCLVIFSGTWHSNKYVPNSLLWPLCTSHSIRFTQSVWHEFMIGEPSQGPNSPAGLWICAWLVMWIRVKSLGTLWENVRNGYWTLWGLHIWSTLWYFCLADPSVQE